MYGIVKQRRIGIDLLRIIAMIGVTMIHYIGYSDVLLYEDLSVTNRMLLALFRPLTMVATNLFVIITGFFMIHKETCFEKAIKLYGEFLFTGILLVVVTFLLGFDMRPVGIIRSLLPLSTVSYWFLSDYLILYFSIPILNKWIKGMSQTELRRCGIIIGGVIGVYFGLNPFPSVSDFIGGGSSLLWFFVLYSIGAYCGLYEKLFSKRIRRINTVLLLLVYAMLTILLFCEVVFPLRMAFYSEKALPATVLSICFLIALKDIKVEKNCGTVVVENLSNSALLVYAIQENDLIRSQLWNVFDAKKYAASRGMLLQIVCVLIVLWVGAIVINMMWQIIYRKIVLPKIKGVIERV